MAKRTTTLALMLPPQDPATTAYRWLCTAVRAEILSGRLPPGARLPATRDLARQYGLARGTIVGAFEQLRAEGYLRGKVGSGTYVNQVLPDDLLHAGRWAVPPAPQEPPAPRLPPAEMPPPAPPRAAARPPAPPRAGARPPALARAEARPPAPPRPEARPRLLSRLGRRVSALADYDPGPARAFRTNQPALDLFPTALWAQIAARRLRRATSGQLLGCGPLGYRPLQEAVAFYLTTSRGVVCAPEQVAILSGVQEALDLAARLLVDPGDRVVMEDPGYGGAAKVLAACGAAIAFLRVDEEGMTTPPPTRAGARLAYVTPGHQFPLGTSMSLPRRLQLLAWARRAGAMVFEDDYDSEFRYSGRPVPALQGLDRDGLVLFAGSFSKVLFPSLRLGYLVIPPVLIDAFAAAKSITSRHAPLLDQVVLCDFIAEGHFARHLRRMREIYAERSAALLESARTRLAGLLEIAGIEAGLQTAAWLCGDISEDAAAAAAAARGVEVTPMRQYCRGPAARPGLQLGFAAVDAREIRRAVPRLAAALEAARHGGARPSLS